MLVINVLCVLARFLLYRKRLFMPKKMRQTMKQIYYVIQTLLRGRGSNVIKTVSLTLGLFVGILLFARVAFELSYYNFLHRPAELYVAYLSGFEEMSEGKGAPYTFGPFSAAVRENFPEEVEDATILREKGESVYYCGDTRLSERTVYADEHLFPTLGIGVLAGKPGELSDPNAIFVSRALASKVAGSGNPADAVGKVLYADRKTPFNIRGVFEDMGDNTDIAFDAVIPMAVLWNAGRGGWGYDISYRSIVRFRNPSSGVKAVEGRLPDMLKRYIPDFGKKTGRNITFAFHPLERMHFDNSAVRTMIVVMFVLAFGILLVAAFNYVLISVSSLAKRAKAIGVHKCSGATDGDVLRMFLMEAFLILLVSLGLVALLMWQFRDFIEDMASARLSSLFTWQTVWAPALAVGLVFALAGVLPALLFASVPVTQVFKRYSERKTSWKRPLLFIQFAGMAFVSGFLVFVLWQYRMVMTKDVGYNPDRVATCWFKFGGGHDNAAAFFRNLPMVESYGAANQLICSGYSGDTFDAGDNRKVDTRIEWVDPGFVSMMGIRLLKGRDVAAEGEILVSEEFVRQAGWTGDPIGRQVSYYDGSKMTVAGVVPDYSIRSAYESQLPIMLIATRGSMHHYLRLKEPFDENLRKLNEVMKEAFPADDAVFVSLRGRLDRQYSGIARFRNAVWLASVSILLIALMGLLGYVNDEIRLRSKEIAIRKVNGAQASEVLAMLAKEVWRVAVPALCIGIAASWAVGAKWLEQFNEYAYPDVRALVYVALGIWAVITGCVLIRAERIASDDPVRSIRME